MQTASALREPASRLEGAPELTVVVPCYNEQPNVAVLVQRLQAALAGVRWAVVFVDDDSPDGTADTVRALAQSDARVNCIRRVGRRGLASAVIEGALASSATFVAVIDGDLQHDETRLVDMLALLRRDACDVALASRYLSGGDAGGLSGNWRRRLSGLGIRLAQAFLPVRLTDPMSGFFMLRRDRFEAVAPRLTGKGFKILLDLLLSDRRLRVREVPASFGQRAAGQSKLDALVLTHFGAVLLDKALGGVVPLRFLGFAAVGAAGVVVNVAVVLVLRRSGMGFSAAQGVATLAAMAANFELNNRITYRDQMLRGRQFWSGLVLFVVGCGIGAVANVGIASTLFHDDQVRGSLAAGAGALIGVVWNYTISATLVWRRR